MRRSTLLSRFLLDYAPGPLPARGPDGLIPAPPPPSGPTVEPPSLCEAGPCLNYHRLSSVMDSADPLRGSAGARHAQITRACYPAPGVEVELGEAPVLQCSRWHPETDVLAVRAREDARRSYLATDDGKQFAAQARSFERATGMTEELEDDDGTR